MYSYRIADERIVRNSLNQRKTNIDIQKELLKSKSKIEINKDKKNFKKYSYKKIEYHNTDITKMKYNNKNFFFQKNQTFLSPNNYMNYMNITSPKNLKYYKQNVLDHTFNNIYIGNAYKTNHCINNINNINVKKEKSKSPKNYNQVQDNMKIYLEKKGKLNSKTTKNKSNINVLMNNINIADNRNIKYIPIEKNTIHNCGNKITTTNNTYNNNIYYINPIEYINNKIKKLNTNNKKNPNIINKSIDIGLLRQKTNNKKLIGYFKMNNKKEKIKKSIILIQSVFRAYLVKMKLFNNLNFYLSCKRGVDILQKILIRGGVGGWKIFFKKLKNNPYKKIYSPIITRKNNSFHKELGDSFNIIGEKSKEKKMELTINLLLKENKELKNKLLENKNIGEKIRLLSEENKKMQSINNIILKDNKQLAKKLKDLQEYRKNKLVIQKDIEKMQIHENNEELFNKEKYIKLILKKFIAKKINEEKNILKLNWDKYKVLIKTEKNNQKQNDIIKNILLKNIFNIIEKNINSIKQKIFLHLYYKTLINQNSKNVIKDKLKTIMLKLEKNRIKNISKSFFNILKASNNNNKNNNIIKKDINNLRKEKLRKIFNKYIKNVKIIYKIILEKWNLKSKLIGIRTVLKEKKKKRKQKKKINKLLYNKHYLVVDNYKHRDNSNQGFPRLSKSIQGFNYIVSDNDIIKTPNMEEGKLIFGNLSSNNIKCIYKNDKKRGKSQIITNKEKNKENIINKENENDEDNSDEDSGDSLGLEDKSDDN